MELIIFTLQLILGIFAVIGTAFILAVILIVAQDADRRRVYGNEHADYILKCMHKNV